MLVRHVLDRKGHATHFVGPDTIVLDALRLMAEHEIGALLVMQDDRVLGVVSERDYARKVALLGRASRETPVSQIMSAPAVTVSPDDTRRRRVPLLPAARSPQPVARCPSPTARRPGLSS